MRLLPRVRSWLRSLFQRARLEQDLESELQFHLDTYAADLVRQGYSEAEARRLARIALGTKAGQKEDCRASLGLRLWDEVAADARYGVRMLRKDPLLTCVAVASMALGIGANTALFSVAKTVLFDTLGVPHPEQLRVLEWQYGGPQQPVGHIWGGNGGVFKQPNGNFSSGVFSYPVYQALAQRNDLFDGIAAFEQTSDLTSVIDRQATVESGALVSGNFFHVFGISTIAGRSLGPGDTGRDSAAVVVLSYEFWVSRFAQSRDVIGKTIRLNSVPVTIVGVAPPDFVGPDRGSNVRLFLPVTLQGRIERSHEGEQLRNGDSWWLALIGRLQPGISDARAQAALNAMFQQTARATLSNRRHFDLSKLELMVRPGSRGLGSLRGRLARPVSILFSLVALVLLLACTNVANLLVARSTARSREMSVRKALGAGRGRLVRQMFIESLLLSTLAAFGGLLLAFAGRGSLAYFLDIPAPAFDWQILAFTAALALLTGLLFGLAPALQVLCEQSTVHTNESSRMTSSRPKAGLRKALVVLQVALSAVLLIGAALFVRTLSNLLHAELGFAPQRLLLFDLHAPANRIEGVSRILFYQQIEERLRALPGVRDVTLVDSSLMSGGIDTSNFDRNDQPRRDGTTAWEHIVGNTFFQVVGIPIRQGRAFSDQDTPHSRKVAIVNQQLARTFFPHDNPIGKTFNEDQTMIVGICRDSKYSNLREAVPPTYFLPYSQQTCGGGLESLTVYVKTATDPSRATPTIRKTIAAIDPELPMMDVRTQEQQIDTSLSHERLFAALTSAFGMLALFLATIGIYGVMSYTVTRRTSEVGIRLALGAQAHQILRLMMTEGMALALGGCVSGVGAALYLARYVRSQFYGVTAYDPVVLLMAALILLASAGLAVWLPARRAARISPVEALRHS